LARSQPACRHCDAHAIAHADAQTADAHACARAANSDAYRLRNFYAHSDAYGHSDGYTLGYAYSQSDDNVDTDA
jgi:hypothetical protein